MNPQSLDLHDARIGNGRFDEKAGTVMIDVDYFEARGAGQRTKATLVFEGVRPSPHIAEMLKLANSRRAGNVLHWEPAVPGNTSIYLLDGVITLRAEKLSVRPAQSGDNGKRAIGS